MVPNTHTTLARSGGCRLLAREIEDVAGDRSKDDVEEPGDDTCSCFWTQKVIALNDIAFVEQNCHWDGTLIQEIPLCERISVSSGSV